MSRFVSITRRVTETVLALGCALLASGGPAGAEEIVVSNYGVTTNGMPFAVAMEKGFFKEFNANVTGILSSDGGGTTIRKLRARPWLLPRLERRIALPLRFVHVLRNAMIPVLTNVSLQLPGVFVGSFLIETFFSIPGLGREVLLAVNRSDYPVIQAVTVYLAVLTMFINLIADILYKVADPRVVLK